MDEMSLQARLAKSNINITNITDRYVFFEFPYRPKPGDVKWNKSYIEVEKIDEIPLTVLEIRKLLER